MLARENPFRTELVELRQYRFPPGDCLESLTGRFEAAGSRGAIVGPKGRGKTTLLELFADHLTAAGQSIVLLRLNRDTRADAPRRCHDALASADPETILLVDGAEQLGWLDWRRVVRRTRSLRGLLITTHRPGRLTELIRCETSPELLTELVRDIAPEQFDEVRQQLPALFREHGGNIRLCLRALYDQYA